MTKYNVQRDYGREAPVIAEERKAVGREREREEIQLY